MTEVLPDPLEIDVTNHPFFLILENDHGASITKQLNYLQPVVEVRFFSSLISDKNIEGAFGKKKLVCLLADLLALKIPDVHPEFLAIIE